MTTLSIILAAFGVGGIAFGGICYYELWKWARLCQGARIFIAYNNRVKLDAPLTEWLEWARMLKGDEQAKGRIIYQANKMRVGILNPRKPSKTTVNP
jgi:hypothetical protein